MGIIVLYHFANWSNRRGKKNKDQQKLLGVWETPWAGAKKMGERNQRGSSHFLHLMLLFSVSLQSSHNLSSGQSFVLF